MIGERICYKKRSCLRTQAKLTAGGRNAVPSAKAVAAGVSGMTTAASADGKWQEKEGDPTALDTYWNDNHTVPI